MSTHQQQARETLCHHFRWCMTGYYPYILEPQKPEDSPCAKAIANVHTNFIIQLLTDLRRIRLLTGCSAIIRADMRCTQLLLLPLSTRLCSQCSSCLQSCAAAAHLVYKVVQSIGKVLLWQNLEVLLQVLSNQVLNLVLVQRLRPDAFSQASIL